jgi:hypothetical protein
MGLAARAAQEQNPAPGHRERDLRAEILLTNSQIAPCGARKHHPFREPLLGRGSFGADMSD